MGNSKMRSIRLAMAQINTCVGNLDANTAKIKDYIRQARKMEADLVTFPELAVTGYPPEDLLLKPDFIDNNLSCLQEITDICEDITAIVGFVDFDHDIYNAAAILHDKSLKAVYHKNYLPNYGVFDENRYFQADNTSLVFTLNDIIIGVNICEDIWYPGNPMRAQVIEGKAELIVNISASPYYSMKGQERARMLATRAVDNVTFVAFNNLVGGQDELVFDGHGMVFDQDGHLIACGEQFEEDLIVIDLDLESVFRKRLRDPKYRKDRLFMQDSSLIEKIELGECRKARKPESQKARGLTSHKTEKISLSQIAADFRSDVSKELESQHELSETVSPSNKVKRQSVHGKQSEIHNTQSKMWKISNQLNPLEEIYSALVLGTKDYVKKNGFEKVVIGISGGIDSAMTAMIAVDSLGVENVIGVSMPSQYSSNETRSDAQVLAENLGIEFKVIPISDIFHSYLGVLSDEFEGLAQDVTEENIQARVRGNILMALANKFNYLVLTTGNKSEMSVGYCTLYGDMSGGFAVLKDVPKTLVYKLAEYRNSLSDKELIPVTIIERTPSAELRPEQKDEDSLPPYEILDLVLEMYIEQDKSVEQIVNAGFDPQLVREVCRMVDRNEYKRRQSPPGVKITKRAFGKDRRLPITNQYQN